MDSRKDIVAAFIFAISLAVGLGAISYGLFSESPPPTKLKSALDVFTQKGGLGVNSSGGDFEPFDNVSIFAYLTQGGIKLANRQVTFVITKPNGTQSLRTASTGDQGTAETDIHLLPSEDHFIGTWHVFANSTVGDEEVNDTLDFQCESQNARIDVLSEWNGVPSFSFLPGDTVLIEARLSYRNAPITGTPVTFDVRYPNGTEFLLQEMNTGNNGTADITFSIPLSLNISSGIWQVLTASDVYGQTLHATTSLECFLQPPVIDLFTQKGGAGLNTPGGHFALNETVALYAEVRDEDNRTVPDQLVSFAIKDPNGKPFYYGTNSTNSSGIASITIRIPPDPAYVGTFEVYANTRYYEIVLLDTLTFIAEQE